MRLLTNLFELTPVLTTTRLHLSDLPVGTGVQTVYENDDRKVVQPEKAPAAVLLCRL